jgi:hypothetical protein
MKRLCIFTALMLLSSAAHADNSFAFQIGGHRVHIDAPRYYRSLSCVSVSTAGVYEMASKQEKFRRETVWGVPKTTSVTLEPWQIGGPEKGSYGS